MELDINQISQMLKFMEDERRKDRAQIAVLQEKLVGQSNEIADLTRRIQDLDASLKTTQTALAKTQKYDSILEEYKTELFSEMNRNDDDIKKATREAERVRILEVETLQRQISEVRKELPRIGKVEDEFPTRRAEEKRLGDMIQRLQPQIEIASQLV